MARLTFVFASLLALASTLQADQYWIAYEGNDFPENEGWTHRFGNEDGPSAGGAVRSIANGALLIDSTRNVSIYDFVSMNRRIDPDPGELFAMTWRLRIDACFPLVDPGVTVFSDESWAVGFEFDQTSLRSVFESGLSVEFTPGLYHAFELRSADMRSYSLYVDGVQAVQGNFVQVFTTSEVAWGDAIQGGSSVTSWEYFRFGVVPEPEAVVQAVLVGLGVLSQMRTIRYKKENRS